jgi:hypothetical protein
VNRGAGFFIETRRPFRLWRVLFIGVQRLSTTTRQSEAHAAALATLFLFVPFEYSHAGYEEQEPDQQWLAAGQRRR